MIKDLSTYIQETMEDVERCIEDKGCQPILFVGSGFSKRYFGAPNWEQLLTHMADSCPLIDKEFAYYKQLIKDNIDIGSEFAAKFQEWAWSEGRNSFAPSLFDSDRHSDVYLKDKVCEFIESICPSSLDEIKDVSLRAELALLQLIKPHSIITTNYDRFIEVLFPDYAPIIGQRILRADNLSIGEIFKIHGCTSDFSNIVLTRSDFDNFINKKKYLSAKLLTYFIEHPLVFIGYSAQDANVISILSDIDEALSNNGDLIDNIYMLNWDSDLLPGDYPSHEKVLVLAEGKSIRIKSIIAKEFSWVFDAFATDSDLQAVNTKTLRAIMARTYDLVRHDIPRKAKEVDFDVLNKAIESDASVAKLFGITTGNNSSSINAYHKYIPSELAEHAGLPHWTKVNLIFNEIFSITGIDIRASDNKYHIKIITSKKSVVRKYSQEALDLIRDYQNGQSYEVEL